MKSSNGGEWWWWHQRTATPHKEIFQVPDDLRRSKNKGKIILVMDLD
jgi:hypothetical protein